MRILRLRDVRETVTLRTARLSRRGRVQSRPGSVYIAPASGNKRKAREVTVAKHFLPGRARRADSTLSDGEMLGNLMADAALDRLLSDYAFQTVLDIGSGEGLHAERFRKAGKTVIALDPSDHWGGAADIKAPFLEHKFSEPFDAIWCSHVLEHQPNVQLFLRHIFNSLKPGGILALTVPPWKTNIVGGHLSIWNAGLLLYNLIIAGFNCRQARVGRYGYNISVIVRKSHAALPPLSMDRGDIEALAPFFPCPVQQDFDGELYDIDWTPRPDIRPVAGPVRSAADLAIAAFANIPALESDEANLRWSAACVGRPGGAAEFGVFQGRSLRILAEELPNRAISGLDSFRGLPQPWVRSDSSVYQTGHFSLTEQPTGFPANVRLYPGFFADSLPVWIDSLDGPLALIHIDADLYESAREVLFGLNAHIAPGTVIVFDELCDWRESGVYPKWPEGEWKALTEWMQACGRKVRALSRGPDFSATLVVCE